MAHLSDLTNYKSIFMKKNSLPVWSVAVNGSACKVRRFFRMIEFGTACRQNDDMLSPGIAAQTINVYFTHAKTRITYASEPKLILAESRKLGGY